MINADIIDFHPTDKYDLIISISTLEHVGWDEPEKDPGKTLRAVQHLKSLLISGGEMVITVPLGHNRDMDLLFKDDKMQFTRIYCMKRLPEDKSWKEVSWESTRASYGNSPFPADNSLLLIGYVKNDG